MDYMKIHTYDNRVLYRLSEPFAYDDGRFCNYVVADWAILPHVYGFRFNDTYNRESETMLFPSDEHGNIIDWGDLYSLPYEAYDECVKNWCESLNQNRGSEWRDTGIFYTEKENDNEKVY